MDVQNLLLKIDDLILYLKTSKEYQLCLKAREKMNENKELIQLVEEVKTLQKKYIRSNYSEEIKKTLDEKVEVLNEIPLFVTYNQNLEVVNQKLQIIQEELNHYFYSKLNKSISKENG